MKKLIMIGLLGGYSSMYALTPQEAQAMMGMVNNPNVQHKSLKVDQMLYKSVSIKTANGSMNKRDIQQTIQSAGMIGLKIHNINLCPEHSLHVTYPMTGTPDICVDEKTYKQIPNNKVNEYRVAQANKNNEKHTKYLQKVGNNSYVGIKLNSTWLQVKEQLTNKGIKYGKNGYENWVYSIGDFTAVPFFNGRHPYGNRRENEIVDGVIVFNTTPRPNDFEKYKNKFTHKYTLIESGKNIAIFTSKDKKDYIILQKGFIDLPKIGIYKKEVIYGDSNNAINIMYLSNTFIDKKLKLKREQEEKRNQYKIQKEKENDMF